MANEKDFDEAIKNTFSINKNLRKLSTDFNIQEKTRSSNSKAYLMGSI